MTVHEKIIQTLLSFGVTFDASVVEGLVTRVEKDHPKKPRAFAYVVARNWAIDQRRHAEHRANIERRQAAEAVAAATERTNLEAARAEYWLAVDSFRRSQGGQFVRVRANGQFLLLWMVALLGSSEEEVAASFPDVAGTTRWKWLQRARDALRPIASENLMRILSRKRQVFRAKRQVST